MVYERYPRNYGPQGDHSDDAGYGRDYGSGRDYSYSSARDYAAAGRLNDDRYGRQDDGGQRYGQRGSFDRDRDYGRGTQGRGGNDWGHSDYGRSDGGRRFQEQERGGDRYGQGGQEPYRGSYASDGRRFEDVGRSRGDDGRRGYGRQPQGYDYEDRGFFQRAGDEVRSWFGDDEAERRREADSRYDERAYRSGGGQHDEHYGAWRSGQIAALDRDYDEYRNENRSRFEREFSTWRTGRQTQRDSLSRVTEHQEVVGSDGTHVGTVDKVRGDRILLTKNDADAGGRHHSIPSSWLTSVDDKVTLSKTADEAKAAWRDEDRNQAIFGYGDDNRRDNDTRSQSYGRGNAQGGGQSGASSSQSGASSSSSSSDGSTDGNLNRSFSGTY